MHWTYPVHAAFTVGVVPGRRYCTLKERDECSGDQPEPDDDAESEVYPVVDRFGTQMVDEDTDRPLHKSESQEEKGSAGILCLEDIPLSARSGQHNDTTGSQVQSIPLESCLLRLEPACSWPCRGPTKPRT